MTSFAIGARGSNACTDEVSNLPQAVANGQIVGTSSVFGGVEQA